MRGATALDLAFGLRLGFLVGKDFRQLLAALSSAWIGFSIE